MLNNYGYSPDLDLSSGYISRKLLPAQVLELCTTGDFKSCASVRREDPNNPFFDTESLDQAVQLMVNGDLKLLKESDRLMAQLNASLQDQSDLVIDRSYSPNGKTLDLGRYLNGDPACLYRNKDQIGESNKITVMFSCSKAWIYKKPEILAYGVCVTAIIRSLMIAGYQIRLYVSNTVRSDYQDGSSTDMILLKDYDQIMDQSVLAFWLAHNSALRRIGFRLNESNPDAIRDRFGFRSSGGYGCCHDLTTEQLADLGIDLSFPNISKIQRTSNPAYMLNWLLTDPDSPILPSLARIGLGSTRLAA